MTFIKHWRSQDFELRGLRTEAPELQTQKASRLGGGEWGGAIPLPSRLWGLGSPAENGFWCILSLKKNESSDDEFDIFVIFTPHI